MKASVFMSTFNKNDCLANTLVSISKQKTSFPFEVCIVDDGSAVDPEPLIRKFLPDVKYKRFVSHIGFEVIMSRGLSLVDPSSDIVIIQSCDVVYLQPFIIEELCKNLKPSSFAMAQVKNIPVSINMFKNFDSESSKILLNWNKYQQVYSGSKRPLAKGKYMDYLFFLGSIMKKDLQNICFDKYSCDCVVNYYLKAKKFTPIILDNLMALHQKHPPAKYRNCSFLKTCKISCYRKKSKGLRL